MTRPNGAYQEIIYIYIYIFGTLIGRIRKLELLTREQFSQKA